MISKKIQKMINDLNDECENEGVTLTLGVLSEEEKKALELFRKCDSVSFYKHDETFENAKKFTLINGNAEYNEYEGSVWFKSNSGKVKTVAFIKEGVQNV